MTDRVKEIGTCADCRRMILSTDRAWAAIVVGRQAVYGRIGDPSRGLEGFTKGTRVYRCGECLRTEGPLT